MSKPASSPIPTASTNCSMTASMSSRVIGRGTWLAGDQGISDAAMTGQLPPSSGTSLPSQPLLVEPFGPEWPSSRQNLAGGLQNLGGLLGWTSSTIRSQAATCSGAYMPLQPGLIRPSGETQVISV